MIRRELGGRQSGIVGGVPEVGGDVQVRERGVRFDGHATVGRNRTLGVHDVRRVEGIVNRIANSVRRSQ